MKKYNIIYLLFVIIGLISCDRDSLYEDPSNPSKASSATLLTALEVNTFMNVEGELSRYGAIYSQHFAGVAAQYLEAQNYDIQESAFNNNWGALYSGTMNNAKLLISDYTDERPYYSGMAKVLLALNLGIATDLWGDVPYSDAFKATEGNFTAKYDSQEDVLKSIQTLLDEAIVDLSQPESENAELPEDADLIFNGDPDSWIRAAWVLKARYANRLSLKDGAGSANQVIQYINNALSMGNATTFMEAPHASSAQNQWGAFENSRAGYIVANKYCVDMMKVTNDPRLDYYFAKDASGEYIGADIQESVINVSASRMNLSSTGFFNVSRNYPLMGEYEAYFLLAEAQSRLGQDASEALNTAIKSSVSYVTNGAFDGSGQANYSNPSMTEILTQKWIAHCGHLEAYNDYRRTGVPALVSRAEAAGAVRGYTPMRLPTPQDERVANPENALPYELNIPVWWAQK